MKFYLNIAHPYVNTCLFIYFYFAFVFHSLTWWKEFYPNRSLRSPPVVQCDEALRNNSSVHCRWPGASTWQRWPVCGAHGGRSSCNGGALTLLTSVKSACQQRPRPWTLIVDQVRCTQYQVFGLLCTLLVYLSQALYSMCAVSFWICVCLFLSDFSFWLVWF